jgi:hypothetical protein
VIDSDCHSILTSTGKDSTNHHGIEWIPANVSLSGCVQLPGYLCQRITRFLQLLYHRQQDAIGGGSTFTHGGGTLSPSVVGEVIRLA